MNVDFTWALRIAARYNVSTDIPYRTPSLPEAKLDVYREFEADAARPTLMFMHGGGWAAGSTKETWALWFLPFLQLGWIVVNVDYRNAKAASAPAAVEDCFDALRWIGRYAGQYHIDTQQLVVAGLSAGAHLALLTGMIPFCPPSRRPLWLGETDDLPRPAAIINWCGITDVADLAEGLHRREWAIDWLGDRPDRLGMAAEVSPMTYVSTGSPPVVTAHGDQDDIVPYRHAIRLHDALSEVGVTNELITLHGARHSSLDAYLDAYPRILNFLARVDLTVRSKDPILFHESPEAT